MHGVWKREKVSFNIASEASYVYKIDQKCIKNAKNGQTVLPDGLISRGQKLVEKSQNKKNWNATFWVIFKQCVEMPFGPVLWNFACRNTWFVRKSLRLCWQLYIKWLCGIWPWENHWANDAWDSLKMTLLELEGPKHCYSEQRRKVLWFNCSHEK